MTTVGRRLGCRSPRRPTWCVQTAGDASCQSILGRAPVLTRCPARKPTWQPVGSPWIPGLRVVEGREELIEEMGIPGDGLVRGLARGLVRGLVRRLVRGPENTLQLPLWSAQDAAPPINHDICPRANSERHAPEGMCLAGGQSAVLSAVQSAWLSEGQSAGAWKPPPESHLDRLPPPPLRMGPTPSDPGVETG